HQSALRLSGKRLAATGRIPPFPPSKARKGLRRLWKTLSIQWLGWAWVWWHAPCYLNANRTAGVNLASWSLLMDKMLYVAMTGASQSARGQQAHANNLANISTTGFRRDFEQARSMQVFGDSFPARVYAMTERPGTDFTAGALQETGRDLDVAIEGE